MSIYLRDLYPTLPMAAPTAPLTPDLLGAAVFGYPIETGAGASAGQSLSAADAGLLQLARMLAGGGAPAAMPMPPQITPQTVFNHPLDVSNMGSNPDRLPTTALVPLEPPVTTALPNDDRKNRFFDALDSRLADAAASLGLPRHYVQGLAAFESGYYDDHNRGLSNPLGLTRAGKNNLSFSSPDDAIAYWKQLYGPQVQGATSPEDFARRLLGQLNGKPVPGWNRYNAGDDWAGNMVGTINSIDRHRQTWDSQRDYEE
ncbi:MAG: hypothetical protein WDO24_23425 [Pseudomonadota bacterium]